MAAYAALVSLINDLELIQNHPRHSFSFENKQIASLSQTVHFLIAFLESYDALGRGAEVLESRIASAAHAAHDVVESHVVDQIHSGSTLRGKARPYLLLDLQKAIDNMSFVERKVMQFKAKNGMTADQETNSQTSYRANVLLRLDSFFWLTEPQIFRKNRMVGFDAVTNRLMEMLVGEPSSRLVIPIVGMDGMGKSTLAKYAYEHALVEHRFDVRYWVTISQAYSAETILAQLISRERKSTVNELGQELHKKLWGRRYLIIFDDMCSIEAWDEIKLFLPENGSGSRVIVTTRLSNLANYLSSSPFKMDLLDEDNSWKLFCEKTFDEEECPHELEEIGRRIVGKCHGLSLSIVVIGGHLRNSSKEIEYWEKVANLMDPISSLDEGEKCMKIIRLSYDQLPVHLKPCFLYMGKYEKDDRIDAAELLRLWVADGFVRKKKGQSLEIDEAEVFRLWVDNGFVREKKGQSLEEDYLKELIDRNLVIVHQRRWNGKPQTCGIHDIIRQFCIKVGKKEKFVSVFDRSRTNDISRERRIVIPYGKQESDIVNALKSAPLLRSVTSYHHEDLPLELKLLRVSEGGCSLAAGFQPLNLRYFTWHSIHQKNIIHIKLPWSVSLFWNLQTLIMMNYGDGITAPQEIWEMVQLRHLEFYKLYLPDPIPSDQQECNIVLENLQTLNGVWDFRLMEEVCRRMPNIKELYVSYAVEHCSDYYPGNLGRFQELESLKLHGNCLVQSFTFPSLLQELDLECCDLGWEDVGVIIQSLPYLVVLHLRHVKGHEWSLVEEHLPFLKSLYISSCDDLISWNTDDFHFPSLERLEITNLHKLSEIPLNIGEIPTLELIKLENSSVSAAVSAMRILVEQHSFENHSIQLHVEFDRMEEVERFQEMVQEEDLQSNNLRLHCQGRKMQHI